VVGLPFDKERQAADDRRDGHADDRQLGATHRPQVNLAGYSDRSIDRLTDGLIDFQRL